jgi:hypothetical protein
LSDTRDILGGNCLDDQEEGRRAMMRLTAKATFLFGVLAISGCGASFKAVDATGKLGQKIDGSVAQTAPPQLCTEMSALLPTPCSPDGKWGDIADAMVAYSSKLSALANKDDVDAEDAVKSALGAVSDAKWSKLSSDQNGAIASFAGAVVSALSMAYRSGVLDDVIQRSEPHVKIVGELLVGEAELRISQIDMLTSAASDVLNSLPSVPKPAPSGAPPSTPVAGAPASGTREPALGSQPTMMTASAATNPPTEPAQSTEPQVDSASMKKWIRNQEAKNQVIGQAAGLGLVILLQDLATKKRAYTDLKANVAAFCAAHAKLAANAGHLSADELLTQVLKVAKAAADVQKNFKSDANGAAAKN